MYAVGNLIQNKFHKAYFLFHSSTTDRQTDRQQQTVVRSSYGTTAVLSAVHLQYPFPSCVHSRLVSSYLDLVVAVADRHDDEGEPRQDDDDGDHHSDQDRQSCHELLRSVA